MSLEPPEPAELRCALGCQLAALRQAAGIGQQQVARRTGYSRSSVAHAEAGRQLLSRDFWKTADDLVKADGALLAGYERVQAARQEHERQSRDAELAAARARAEALRATTAPQPAPQLPWGADQGTVRLAHEILTSLSGHAVAVTATGGELTEGGDQAYDQLATFLRGWADRMNRRQLLQLLRWAATTIAASAAVSGLDAEEQERLGRAIASPSRVDTRVIDHIEAMLQHCKRQEDALGSRVVLNSVLAQRHMIDGLLADCSASLRPRLLSVGSDMSTSIGYYFFELNDLANAKHYFDQARVAAHDAGNIDLGIYALCEMSYLASWQGKAPASLDLAAAVEGLLSKADDPLMQVGAAQRAATAYAVDGRHKACMVELERAQVSLASAGPVSPESPAYFYNEGYLASHRSECLLRLGESREAAVSAGAGLMLYDKSFVDGYAVCTLHLGNARLQTGEIDEAARVIAGAAGLAAQTRSARLMKELRTTRVRMQPWQNTPAVKALDERLAGMGV